MTDVQEIKLISLDLDGTLLTSDLRLSSANRSALECCRQSGIHLVFNTARCFKAIPKSLFTEFSDQYWVFSNGTTGQFNGQTLFDHSFRANQLSGLIRYLLRHEIYFVGESSGNIYSVIESYNNESHFAQIIDLDQFYNLRLNKLLVLLEKNIMIEDIQRIPDSINHFKSDHGKYLQYMPASVNKLSAINSICDLLNLGLDNVMAFGDDINDIELITNASVGIAMKNAIEIVKKSSDYIAESNENQGVALFLNSFFGGVDSFKLDGH